jgi:agmatine/peptidylarginine deiminase
MSFFQYQPFKSGISFGILMFISLFFVGNMTAQNSLNFQRNPNNNKALQIQKAKSLQKLKQRVANNEIATQERNNAVDDILPENIRYAAQFEENQAIAITWAYNVEYDENFNITAQYIWGDSTFGKISCDLADAIQGNAKVLIRVLDYGDTTIIKQIMQIRGTPLYNYSFYQNGIDSWWDRDSGPVCFYYSDQDSVGILDMDYYTYDAVEFQDGVILTDYNEINIFNRIRDDSIPLAIGNKLGYKVFQNTINNEGGNLIFDGLGTTWSSTRTREQNVGTNFAFIFDPITYEVSFDSSIITYDNYPALDDTGFEQLFKTAYQTDNFVEPITLDCDGGTGHLDIYCKLFDENRLGVMDYSNAPAHSDYGDWSTNNIAFQSMQDANGQNLDIRSLPMPLTYGEVEQSECEIDQRTYINGVFVNKAFIMPVMSDPKTGLKPSDVEAVAAFQAALPGYKIIPVHAEIMYGTGGSLHCITHEIPAENPIFIRHTALRGTQGLQNNYALTAEIKNKSGIASAKAYFRKAGQTQWQSLNLTAAGNNQFNFALPGAGFTALDTIEYFIEAISNNGKTITKPFTAREGGYYRFNLGNFVETEEIFGSENIVVSPNPSTGLFQLKGLDIAKSAVNIKVSNLVGKTIFEQKITTDNITLDLTSQIPGVYLLSFESGNGISVKRLVKI